MLSGRLSVCDKYAMYASHRPFRIRIYRIFNYTRMNMYELCTWDCVAPRRTSVRAHVGATRAGSREMRDRTTDTLY